MKRSEASEIVAVLMAAYPYREVPAPTIRLYEQTLETLDEGDARTAVHRLICTSKFMPTIAEILEVVTEVRRGARRTGMEAWVVVCQAIRRFGPYQYPEFDDPLLVDIVRRWGWPQLCNNDSDATRSRFVELYDAVAQRDRADAQSSTPNLLESPGARRLKS